MVLRKINAVLSLLTTVLLLHHAIFLSVWMLARCSFEISQGPTPMILLALMVLHAVISIILAFLGHKGAEKRKCKTYSRLNAATNVQRYTGILMLLLMGLHIAGAANYYQPKILHAIVHPIFFGIALAHVSISCSKALITLGIGNARAVRYVDIITRILCGVIFIACVTGFYLCLFAGVAK